MDIFCKTEPIKSSSHYVFGNRLLVEHLPQKNDANFDELYVAQRQAYMVGSLGFIDRRRCERRTHFNFHKSNPTQSEDFLAWESELDALGSELPLKQLSRMVSIAPERNNSLYQFVSNVYFDRLREAMIEWEDGLDSLGAFPKIKDLENYLVQAPDQEHPMVIFARGVLAQRELSD